MHLQKIIIFVYLINDICNGTELFCDKENCESKEESCQHFNINNFGSKNASVFVIESKGRLGNHLITYTIIQALQKKLNIQPFILQETYDYMSKYFGNISLPILEKTFCNYQTIPFQIFDGGINELVDQTNQHYRRGHLIELWPFGYKPHATVCCPADELSKYIQDNFLEESRHLLTFLPKFRNHVQELKQKAADRMGHALNKITFVGIHNRRTDYLDFMRGKFGVTKNPYTKSFFQDAMEYFREEYQNVVFFYVSDDMTWGRKNIKNKQKDLFFVGKGDTDSPDAVGYDLALLASCNHTIITWGSFSMWAAMLSGGEYYSQYGVIVPKRLQMTKKERQRNQ